MTTPGCVVLPSAWGSQAAQGLAREPDVLTVRSEESLMFWVLGVVCVLPNTRASALPAVLRGRQSVVHHLICMRPLSAWGRATNPQHRCIV